MASGKSEDEPSSGHKRKGSNRGMAPDTISNLGPPSPDHERPASPKGERDPAAVNPGKRAFMKHDQHKE